VEKIPEKAVGFFFDFFKALASPITGNGRNGQKDSKP
jgi:hypothetical protein